MFLQWLLLLAFVNFSLAQFAYDEEGAEEILDHLKKELGARTLRRIRGGMGGGLINTGQGFIIDNKLWVQIKCNYNDKVARPMFEGEMNGLNMLRDLNMPNIKIAKPFKVIDLPFWKGGACLVVEWLKTDPLRFDEEKQKEVGIALAHLHLHNKKMKTEQPEKYVSKFGYHMPTYCGRVPYDNTWKDNWVDFIMTNRIQYQMNLLKDKGDNEEPYNLWEFKVKAVIPKLFENITVEPSLLHGDLWHSNVGFNSKTKEAHMYDPALFYGHHEYDLAITRMFRGFTDSFYEAYHSLIPKEPGFEDRAKLYELFHYLNHWNQYGPAYIYKTVDALKDICLRFKLQGVCYKRIEDEFKDHLRAHPNHGERPPVKLRTKNTNKAALFNTTRNRGRYANMTKSTTIRQGPSKTRKPFVKVSKTYEPTKRTRRFNYYDEEEGIGREEEEDEMEPADNRTTLSLNQIYQFYYAQQGFNWKKKRRKK